VDKYTWVDVGSSWAVADLLAAMLFAQLERSEAIQRLRHRQWDRYHLELDDWTREHGIARPEIPADCQHSAHMYHLRLHSIGERDGFISHLRDRGVQAVFHYQSLHLSAVGQKLGGVPGQFPVTEDASDTLVRLPLHTSLSNDDQSVVIDAVRSYRPEP
jgi:dTDP-4-amino-4,6-dideoxygalactose transaminase